MEPSRQNLSEPAKNKIKWNQVVKICQNQQKKKKKEKKWNPGQFKANVILNKKNKNKN